MLRYPEVHEKDVSWKAHESGWEVREGECETCAGVRNLAQVDGSLARVGGV